MKSGRIVAVLVVAAVVAGGVVWKRRQASTAATAPAAAAAPAPVVELSPVDVARVERGTLERTIPLSGTLRPYEQTVVKARVAGELREMRVREGETVRRGQVLARIDDTDAQARAAERRAQVEAARAQFELSRKNRRINEELLAKGFISQNAFDNVASSQQVGDANLKAAEAQFAVTRKALADTVVTAPIDGVVSERHAQPGEKLAVDARIVSLVDMRRVELEAEVPGAEIGFVRVGMPVEFVVEGLAGRPFVGRVDRINPTADERSRGVKVYAVLDNADGALRGGMFAKGQLRIDARADALLLPLAAVREEAGQPVAWVVEGDAVARRALVLGERDLLRGVVAVQSGVAAGDTVLVGGLVNVRPGTRVARAATPPQAVSAPATRP
ncbi:MAG: efflux RND transporter periplasmic adaptor subunit [Burkholderiales bacterium]|jgi:RND family efflux transporter MFP subunit|nr:efflux RND transporter periplasmic adaptor subunit [Burkholderiales bacterium]